jgi:MFS transporter, DHA1 family, multidrug resistance protein
MPGPPALWLLAIASALSPFGMIVIVPALGAVATHYDVTPGAAQWLIATYLFGLGVGQPVSGALADRIGRRPVILGGFVLFVLSSIAAALSPSFLPLVVARFFQAVGVSVGTVGARAIIRDTHDAIGAARAMGVVGAAMGIPPVVGPPIGGFLSAEWGPPAVFSFSAALGLATMLALWARLPETRMAAVVATAGPWMVAYRQLLAARVFLGFTLLYAFTQGVFFSFLAVGAPFFATRFGIDAGDFGLLWGAMGLVYVTGAAASGRVTRRLGAARALRLSTTVTAAGGLVFLGVVAAQAETPLGLLAPLAVMMGAAGIQTTLALAGAVNHRPDIAGTAAGLSSALALAICGALTILSGLVYDGDFLPIALVVGASALMTRVSAWLCGRG